MSSVSPTTTFEDPWLQLRSILIGWQIKVWLLESNLRTLTQRLKCANYEIFRVFTHLAYLILACSSRGGAGLNQRPSARMVPSIRSGAKPVPSHLTRRFPYHSRPFCESSGAQLLVSDLPTHRTVILPNRNTFSWSSRGLFYGIYREHSHFCYEPTYKSIVQLANRAQQALPTLFSFQSLIVVFPKFTEKQLKFCYTSSPFSIQHIHGVTSKCKNHFLWFQA